MVNNTNRVRSRFEERALGNVRRLFLPNRPNRTKTVRSHRLHFYNRQQQPNGDAKSSK